MGSPGPWKNHGDHVSPDLGVGGRLLELLNAMSVRINQFSEGTIQLIGCPDRQLGLCVPQAVGTLCPTRALPPVRPGGPPLPEGRGIPWGILREEVGKSIQRTTDSTPTHADTTHTTPKRSKRFLVVSGGSPAVAAAGDGNECVCVWLTVDGDDGRGATIAIDRTLSPRRSVRCSDARVLHP